jgi:hypothetical protein
MVWESSSGKTSILTSRMLRALRELFRTRPAPLPRTISVRKDGFDFLVNGLPTTSVQWLEVARISTFKHDLFAVDSVCLLFELIGGRSVEVWEEDNGFNGLADHLHDYFSEVPIDWLEAVVQPAFATNARLLYDRYQPPIA